MSALLLTPILALLACAQQPAPAADDLVQALERAISGAIAQAEPSVVAIHRFKSSGSETTLAVRGRGKGRAGEDFPVGAVRLFERDEPDLISFDYGSGVVVGDHGEILTTFHVIKGAERLIVRAAERQQFLAEVIAGDPRSDLAVIAPVEVEGMAGPRLRPIKIGDAATLRKGSFLLALGNPFNAARDGKPSASWGILSNLARRVEADLDEMRAPRAALRLPNYPTLLQLDAKLNLGMSGGAVVNLKGELVGITTSAASPQGFDAMAGYAIPMDRLGRRALETLRQGKEVEYGFLGIKADMGFTNHVDQVQAGSPAANAQLLRGDEILSVGGVTVVDFDTLILAINSFGPGEEVKLKIRRGGEVLERAVVLDKYPVDGEVIVTNRPKPWRGLRVDYPSPLDVRAAAPLFTERPRKAVVVVEVVDGSAAAESGLKKGQLIHKAAGKLIATPRGFAEAVAGSSGPVTLETDTGPVVVK